VDVVPAYTSWWLERKRKTNKNKNKHDHTHNMHTHSNTYQHVQLLHGLVNIRTHFGRSADSCTGHCSTWTTAIVIVGAECVVSNVIRLSERCPWIGALLEQRYTGAEVSIWTTGVHVHSSGGTCFYAHIEPEHGDLLRPTIDHKVIAHNTSIFWWG